MQESLNRVPLDRIPSDLYFFPGPVRRFTASVVLLGIWEVGMQPFGRGAAEAAGAVVIPAPRTLNPRAVTASERATFWRSFICFLL
ncbi:hypothetical protein ADL12_20615 [Streptomyces regalis]|uniref:Uncharacterized protein n=1 Tax=Streptomyces regalis TaxID=68262 RepID=A0A0X3UQ95_9ACTN|nr:hypothetical protein ADL12_20615 [Streptomyces regalis]